MKPIRVVPIGRADPRLLDAASRALARAFRTSCATIEANLDPAFAHHPERNQYHSTAIIEQLAKRNGDGTVIIGITPLDLYIPILTFVFGEAQLGGSCAVVSYHRLHQQFYGLPADELLLTERLEKEAVHEAGHVAGLTHCDDYECVMASSHAVEWLDLKGLAMCSVCSAVAGLRSHAVAQ
ncbi:MAG TPA: archaemetzincin family Zn-dependent metalloprotease [Thermoanaerobaculia bacterium]|nr:archaemetzincin family Zn-dependent metalloprotease [Thermoanaerobaculia bacterium]